MRLIRLIRQIRLTKKGFLRLTKKSLASYLIISTVILSTGLIYLFNPFTTKKAEAAWFNDDWGFRKAITVTVTSSSSDITSLQTLLTVDTTGITAKLQSSCQDLRFTNTSGKLLPYYIDSCNNNSATNKIWVLADLVPKNTTTYTMYMYYGNPAAVAASNSQPYFDNVVGLVGYWTLNDGGSSATAVDSSVVGNNGSLSIGASGTQTTATQAWTNGGTHTSYGNAINFDGTDDFVDSANITQINGITKMTVSAWIKQSALGTNQAIVAKWDYQTQGAWVMQTNGTTNTELTVFIANAIDDAGGNVANTTNANLTTNTWNQVAFVYDGTQSDNAGRLKVYVNGALTSVTYVGTIPAALTSASSTVKIGKFGGTLTRYFSGIVDDVHIYNTARTATQISSDYSNTYTIENTAVGTITPSTSFATEEKAPQPVAYWKFDDGTGTNAQDATTNNKDGTLSGTTKPTWQTEDLCVSGKCLYFDGSTSYVSLGNNAMGAMSGAFSIEGWIRTASSGNIISEYQSAVCGDATFDISSGFVSFHDGSASTNTGNKSVTDNQWHHVVYVYNGSTGMTYVDGIAGADTTGASWRNTCASTDVRIGSRVGDTFFKGFIDDLKVYNYARSAVQVKADFNTRQNPHGAAEVVSQGLNNQPGALSNGLVGYWKTDETSGNLTDSSGNGLTGTATGTTVVAGKFGNARSFNGTSDVVTVTDNSVLKPTSSITVGMWCNVITLSQINCAATKHSTTTNNGYLLFFNSDNKFYFQLGDGVTWATYAASSATISSTGWYHIVGTHDANSTTIYVNGAASGTTGTGGTISQNTNNLLFGQNVVSSAFYIGTMDEIRIYNRALSPAEVTQLYNFAPGPVGYWKFDENSGATVSDASGNADSGTTTGSPSWVAGKYGSALKYNGSSQYTSITAGSALQITNGLTAEAWINPVAASNFVLFKETAGGNGDWWINFGSGNWNCASAGGTGAVNTGVAATLNQWTHVTLAYTASSLKCYVNGVLSGTTDTTPGTLTGNTNAVMVAGYPTTPTTYFNGSVDDVRIYNYERTPDQIVSDMNAGHPAVGGAPVGAPLGHWKFDEGYGTTANNSGNAGSSINGTLNGSTLPSWSNSGKFGKALSFNGSTGYITQALTTATKPANLTFSAWINPTVNNANMMIAELEPAGSVADGRGAYIALDSNGKLNFCKGSATGSYSCATSATTVSANSWQHVAGSFDGSTVKVFLNGVQEASTSNSSAISYADLAGGYPTPGQLYIGAHKTNAVGGGNTVPDTWFFNGLIDEVKLYNYALTADQVKLDMNRQSAQVLGALSDNSTYQVQAANQEYCVPGDSTSCAAPVGEWKFEEGSGNANDTSGNGYTGAATGTTVAPGKFGKARKFNGTSDVITVTDNANIRPTVNLTVEMWCYATIGLAGSSCALTKHDTATISGYDLFFNSDNKFYFQAGDGATAWPSFSVSTSAYATSGWHHVVGTHSSTAHNLYIDGALAATAAGGTMAQNTKDLLMGKNSSDGTTFYVGTIDQVEIFNYTRSAAQVAWDYNRGGPVAWWKMDECQGTILHDSAGTSNATLTIGATGTQTAIGTCLTPTDGTGAWYNGVSGKRNYSLKFDGTDDLASLGTTSPFRQTGAITYAFWTKIPSSGGGHAMGVGATGGQGLGGVAVTQSAITFYWTPTTPQSDRTYSSTVSLTADTWYQIAITVDYSGAGTGKIYLNGVPQTTTLSGGVTTATPVSSYNSGLTDYIGGRYVNSQLYYNGTLDDVRIYNYPLTATQVKGLYNNGAVNFAPSTGAP